jgi:DNA-binding NarL/FixJ family response regulator
MTNHDFTNQLSVHLFGTPEDPFVLSPRQQQIVDLLLQGCGNAEISEVLKIKRRTVKAHFNRLFLRFGISDGIKRVKLATLLYRSQRALEADAPDNAFPTNER